MSILSGLYDTSNPAFDARVCYDPLCYLADAAIVAGATEIVLQAIRVLEARPLLLRARRSWNLQWAPPAR